jgi:hypothetical protein
MVLQLFDIGLADRPAARRLASLVNRLAASRNQIMPIGQRLAFGAKTVGAALGKPVELADAFPVEDDAIHHAALAVRIIRAAPVPSIEKRAGDIGRIEETSLLVLELVQAAPAAAVAQRLPLSAIELGQGPFPKGL